MAINEKDLNKTAGGASDKWYDYSHGSIVNYGSYVVYTVANGRFGVTVQQICQWNNIANPDVIYVGQQLTIYPTIPY